MEKYQITVRHDGLNKIRVISGTDRWTVEERARLQTAAWDQSWAIRSEKERKSQDAEKRRLSQEQKKQSASKQTADAEKAIDECENILATGLSIPSAIDWQSLKTFSTFPKPKPTAQLPTEVPVEPMQSDTEFSPKIGVLAWLLPSLRRKVEELLPCAVCREP